ncbi:MAG TPA: hypothetical protein VIF09_22990, partial [Polyangiaceae bacterium]
MTSSTRLLAWPALLAAVLAPLAGACGAVRDTAAIVGAVGSASGGAVDGGISSVNGKPITALAIIPSTATLVTSGAGVTSQFHAIATLADGTTTDVSSAVTWGSNEPQVGSIAATGVYTAPGALGGVVSITASTGGRSGAAVLTVDLRLPVAGAPPSDAGGPLQGATTPDPTVRMAYPYDGTAFPRDIDEAPLMWLNGATSDVYLVHLSSSTFDYQAYVSAPSARYDFDPTVWQRFTESTS